jgi:hypothetical protein
MAFAMLVATMVAGKRDVALNQLATGLDGKWQLQADPPPDSVSSFVDKTKKEDLQDQKTQGQVKVLMYNLSWECMTGLCCFGSGKTASKFCIPGTWDGRRWKPMQSPVEIYGPLGALETVGFKRSPEQKDLVTEEMMNHYMTSCTFNLLGGVSLWQHQNPYDFVTFVELCAPGMNNDLTRSWGGEQGGFDEQDNPNNRQCGLDAYDILAEHIFPSREYGYVLNKDTTSGLAVHILTIYKKSKFQGAPTVIKTIMTPGRPMTALVFPDGTLLVSIHGIHFRKTLINGARDCGADGSKCEMLSYLDTTDDLPSKGKGSSSGMSSAAKNIKFRHAATTTETEETSGFSTSDLQIIYGAWLEHQIKKDMSEEMIALIKAKNTIIVAGDFNDELNELTSFPLFDIVVSVQDEASLRTCCSDRDFKWLDQYDAVMGTRVGYSRENPTSEKVAKANHKYMADDCGYFANEAAAKKYLDNQMTTLSSATTSEGGKSEYPWPSDIILSSKPISEFQLPEGYTQSINDAMSDHDPVEATIQID